MFRLLVSLICLTVCLQVNAKDSNEDIYDDLPTKTCAAWLEVPSFAEYREYMHREHKTSLTLRGFDNSRYAFNAENLRLALKYGFNWWYTPIFIVANEAAAIEHATQLKGSANDAFNIGLYFFGSESELGVEPSEKGTPIDEANFRKLASRGALEIRYLDQKANLLETPIIHRITGENLLGRINYENSKVTFKDGTAKTKGTNQIEMWGWHTGDFRGILDNEAFLRSNTDKDSVTLASKLYDQGWRAVMNPTDPNVVLDAMNVLENTQRFKSVLKIDPETQRRTRVLEPIPVEFNRHKANGTGVMQALISSRDYYLNVLMNPEGQVTSLDPGSTENMSGETVGYDINREAAFKENMDGVHVNFSAVVRDAVRQGVRYSFSGQMVTPFSASIGAKLMPYEDALELIAQNRQETARMGVDTVWNPYVGNEEEARKALTEMARKKENAITNSRFLASRPGPNEVTIPIGESLGLKPAQLNIVFLDRYVDAKQAAMNDPVGAANTLYVVGADVNALRAMPGYKAVDKLFTKASLPDIATQKNTLAKNSDGLLVLCFRKPEIGGDIRYHDFAALGKRLHIGDFPAGRWVGDRIVIDGWSL